MKLRLKYNSYAQELMLNRMSEEEKFAIINDPDTYIANYRKRLGKYDTVDNVNVQHEFIKIEI